MPYHRKAGIAPRLFLCPLWLLIWVHPLGNALFFCLYIACKISIYYQHGGNKRKSQKKVLYIPLYSALLHVFPFPNFCPISCIFSAFLRFQYWALPACGQAAILGLLQIHTAHSQKCNRCCSLAAVLCVDSTTAVLILASYFSPCTLSAPDGHRRRSGTSAHPADTRRAEDILILLIL